MKHFFTFLTVFLAMISVYSMPVQAVTVTPALNAGIRTMAVNAAASLPYCNGVKEDQVLLWSVATKKWMCKAVASLFPPKCDGAAQALRFDGKAWKCETIGGLLVAHTAARMTVKGVLTCDMANTWGGATCAFKNSTEIELDCPVGTLKVQTGGLSGYELAEKAYNSKFGGEWHVFCYSRPIKIK